ncbi:unnamed protein product [Acanthocheilonema viteae]|uniref:Uncharacterized protein n=1 Tax=Acanthocheilonema viteae TaxID=6277 RepID=A0A498SRB9_ACAVI|nr:unnamed protein product [Acanthocheilonema viteae]
MERLMESLPGRNDEHQIRNDKLSAYMVRKRNNAELVNHILKTLSEVDVLGENKDLSKKSVTVKVESSMILRSIVTF